MAAKKSNKSKKAQKPKESSPAPGANKLNLVALKPQEKQLDAVLEVVESEAPIVTPIQHTTAAVPTPKELPTTTTPAQAAFDEQGLIVAKHNRNAIFQGIGIIVGTVNIDEKNRGQVIIGEQEYPLFYNFPRPETYAALKTEIETTGQKQQRLVVYPRVKHFPSQEKPYQVSFVLSSFDRRNGKGITVKQLDDFQFKLSGWWQFLPSCPIPCISVFRNFTPGFFPFLKRITPQRRLEFLKPTHIPVIWEDVPIEAFRYKEEVDQQERERPLFVEIIAQFLPEKGEFVFSQLRSQFSRSSPSIWKPSKKDKALVMQAKEQHQVEMADLTVRMSDDEQITDV